MNSEELRLDRGVSVRDGEVNCEVINRSLTRVYSFLSPLFNISYKQVLLGDVKPIDFLNMRRLQNSKRVSWASDLDLCQVKNYLPVAKSEIDHFLPVISSNNRFSYEP